MSAKLIVEIQKIFGRTQKGRILSKKAVEIIESPLDEKVEINECNTCGFIFSEDHFSGGCVNCGSQDFATNIENK